jgi:hypothetical protein
MSFKKGDLVTLELKGQHQEYSNVYRVVDLLEDKCILNHPLYPNCYLIKDQKELNNTTARLKSPLEKCMEFCSDNISLLNYNDVPALQAIIVYFLLNKRLTVYQAKSISHFCGSVAKAKLNNSFKWALETVNNNKGVLDEFNTIWYEKYKDIYLMKKTARPNEAQSIFNQSGFVLAQLQTTSVNQKAENV